MTNSFQEWALAQWMKEAARRTPGARLKASLAAGERDYKRKVARGRRAIQAKASAKVRAVRKVQAAHDAEMDKRRWDLLMGSR